ncbi:MAG: hypothetical protein U0271_46205 [Polyangiaceae bacterium]
MRIVIAGLLVGSACLVNRPSPASACGNEVELAFEGKGRTIFTAEQLLEVGKIKQAHEKIAGVLGTTSMVGSSEEGPIALADRSLVIAAVSVIRSGGELAMPQLAGYPAKPKLPDSPEQREKNLLEALSVLEKVQNRNDPRVVMNAGEAEARLPSRQADALATLEGLEAANVLPSSWGYAALTRLRANPGAPRPWLRAAVIAAGAAPNRVASSRCKRMAAAPKICPD